VLVGTRLAARHMMQRNIQGACLMPEKSFASLLHQG
jgi:hypothetical protein